MPKPIEATGPDKFLKDARLLGKHGHVLSDEATDSFEIHSNGVLAATVHLVPKADGTHGLTVELADSILKGIKEAGYKIGRR